ncbi:Chloride ion channel protein, voltage-gated [Alteracholeplasma palmae J233]|uniref:Chloride ion channel protein, voltage-gated n=1 Tax=Alteracholeplasma palmae (strain ATCC 49389 / J233) TaxID=1318466 RepID=U4KR97_ALTPJ|nr:ClC family H(+)/Cl(-) exchange transporter [Alteracholeplasma palmae]CCV63971.1 Chloride ion channel protein, voltage-gated [Alteracholeplasma palmae J233]
MGKIRKIKSKLSVFFMIFYGVLTGMIAGLFLYGFKQLAALVLKQTVSIFEYVKVHPWYIPLLFIGLAILAYLVALIIKKEPNAGGGAIARTEGFLRGLITFKWLRTTLATLVSSLLVFFGGLPYGIEGSSVIMGTTISGGVSKLGQADPSLERYILTSGASAGFAVATGSPLAGIVFSLEEMHKKFSFLLLIVSMAGASAAALTIKVMDHIFNTSNVFFPIGKVEPLPLSLMWLTIIIGIIAGLVATGFNKFLEKMNHYIDTKLKKVTQFIRILVNFLLVGIAGLFLVEILGNGHHLLIEAMERKFAWTTLLVLLIVKIILISVSVGSGVTGGLFVPSLVIGGLTGALINELFISLGVDANYTKIIIILAMGAFFGTSIHAPITTIVFMIEATQDPYNVLAMVLVLLVAMVTAHAFKNESNNDTVLERILRKQDKGKTANIYELVGKIQEGAFVVNKPTRDILWPANSLITTIKRENDPKGHRMVKGGDKLLKSLDTIVFQVQSYDLEKTKTEFTALIGNQELISKQLH